MPSGVAVPFAICIIGLVAHQRLAGRALRSGSLTRLSRTSDPAQIGIHSIQSYVGIKKTGTEGLAVVS
eukprot:2997887-Prymnesium_polylepis.1